MSISCHPNLAVWIWQTYTAAWCQAVGYCTSNNSLHSNFTAPAPDSGVFRILTVAIGVVDKSRIASFGIQLSEWHNHCHVEPNAGTKLGQCLRCWPTVWPPWNRVIHVSPQWHDKRRGGRSSEQGDETWIRRRTNAGPPSTTLAQHWSSVGSMWGGTWSVCVGGGACRIPYSRPVT